MVDLDAVNLVKEALRSGKSENEVIVLMRQAGYTDQAVSDVLTEAKKGASPADELARRIAAKNNIPVQQKLPNLGPPNLPSQPPLIQPMSLPASGVDKSIIGMFKLSIDSFLHPEDTFKKIKGGLSMGDGAKLIGLCGIIVALIISLFMLVGMLLLSALASAVSLDLSLFFVSWIIGTIVMLVVVPVSMLLGWIIGAGILWISAKVLGGTRSYSEFASEIVIPQVGISLANIAVIVVEFIILIVMAVNAAGSLISAISSGNIFGAFGALAAFTSTMMIGGAITGLISLVFGIYALYVLVVFIRESMEISTLKAVVAIFLPIIVVFVIGAVIASIFVWYWVSPLTSTIPGTGTSAAGITACKDAAVMCSLNLATGTYSSGSQCETSCRQACTSSSGTEVVPNAVNYCMAGESSSITTGGGIGGYSLSVMHCDPDTNTLDIKNTGGTTINDQSFSLINMALGMRLLSVAGPSVTLSPGETGSLPIDYDLKAGDAYALRATSFPDIVFTC